MVREVAQSCAKCFGFFFFSLFLNCPFIPSFLFTTIVLIFAIFHSLFTSMIWKGHWGTGNEKNHASKSLVRNSSKKNHSRFFGFLLCRKKLPIVEREREIPLFFFKKDSRHWLYAITTKSKGFFNRKWKPRFKRSSSFETAPLSSSPRYTKPCKNDLPNTIFL